MNLKTYHFVALDLETTGLSPERDTIIEVAAVRFQLERDGDTFRPIHTEERTMLIDPSRKLEENISMITGITDAMLVGKPKWDDVREKVREFIGEESIIVGHNVLFDIGMLGSHGIDLSGHIALDTFELSEIFSQDAESLNLGFLGKKYGVQMESEHRALDDTRLSMELLCIYLRDIAIMNKIGIDLWHHASARDTSGILRSLLEVTDLYDKGFVLDREGLEKEYFGSAEISDTDRTMGGLENTPNTIEKKREIISLSGDQMAELNLIESHITGDHPLLILTPNRKQSEYMKQVLIEAGHTVSIYRDTEYFCSIDMLSHWLGMAKWNRKESILIVKLMSWIRETETGLLDELKYYGDERSLIELFGSRSGENHRYIRAHEVERAGSEVTIADLYTDSLDISSIIVGEHSLIVRDIVWIEDIVRRKQSRHISFEGLISLCEKQRETDDTQVWEDLIMGISIVADIYRRVPERPIGDKPHPPGDFGETYFITQRALWCEGYRWLILATEKLRIGRDYLRILPFDNLIARHSREKLRDDLDLIIHMTEREDANTNIILSIMPGETKVSYIPRDVKTDIERLLTRQGGSETTLIGYGVESGARGFLERECGITGEIVGYTCSSIMTTRKQLLISGHKTVILTTSMKHIRMLVQELRGRLGIRSLYGQGVSGGKGKMMSLFERSTEKSVLIGLIDSWIDESSLWSSVDEVIIAKVPFDPPTDPYFLARTVGMSNNFEEYSTPIALTTMNTLIGRIHFAHPDAHITCIDERLSTMKWGQEMREKLL